MTIQEAMQSVENIMFEVVNSDVKTLREASRHILDAGGKRVRPRLTMLAYSALGGTDYTYAAPPAAAIELVHTASVVHDDINDHGVVRRGRPSVNAIWGRTFALLTGDFLFTKVYELMASYKDLNIDLAEATVALVEGETLQAAAVKENNFTREVYYQIIARKTAALFKSAATIGAKLAHADEKVIEALGQYGYSVGLAFQIIDDILDLTADTAKLGKTSGIDLAQGRGYVAAYANNGHTGVAVAEAVVEDSDLMTSIKAKLLKGDAINEARIQARTLAQTAIACLDVLPESQAKRELIDLANMVVDRDH
ncbi:MAG: polyprenyl synthetase family protein [Chloroflexi bacterium]|nr:polyprenyl synthetase family protein [Chloroflexota bacterium]MCC6892122.1 polyprenyl synthetase family protein [Anaerolineae bacterium]